MKNVITVDVDTDRKVPGQIVIGKSPDVPRPKSKEEFLATVETDMATLCEGVCILIHLLEQAGGRKSYESLKICIDHLQKGFAEAGYKGVTTIDIKPTDAPKV